MEDDAIVGEQDYKERHLRTGEARKINAPMFKKKSAAEHMQSMLPQIHRRKLAAGQKLILPDDMFEGGES